jgi:myo-inositol-1(or 4)-monophosphatase
MDRDLARARRLAVDLAVEAGRLQVVRRSSVVVGDTKSHANDLVSDVDLASERLIVDGISAEWRGDGILAEEGSSAPSTSGWRWVIDPLDGTRNYLTGAGPWSVCIALQQAGATRMAVVHDPVAGETFSAVAGAGAELDGAAMAVSSTARVDEAIVGLSFDPSPATKRRMVGLVSALLPGSGTYAGFRPRSPLPTRRPGGSTPRSWSTPSPGTSPPACCSPPRRAPSSGTCPARARSSSWRRPRPCALSSNG